MAAGRSAFLSSVLALVSVPLEQPRWDPAPLDWLHRQRLGSLRKGILALTLTGGLDPPRWTRQVRQLFSGVFGDLHWPGHAFHARPVGWGFKLQEPQVTQAWMYFLGPQGGGIDRRLRCSRFLRALDRASGRETPWIRALEADPPEIRVDAEMRMAETGGRIDLYFGWEDRTGRCHAVGVELKLEHHVTDGQLEGYWQFLRQETRFCAGYLVTKTGTEELEGIWRERWGVVAWAWLLRELEVLMAGEGQRDADPQFQLFRSSLWSRILWY